MSKTNTKTIIRTGGKWARRRRQSGSMFVEFAFVALLFIPLFMGTFVTGMNLIRSAQVNHMARDLANMYIHGADFSNIKMQLIAKKLATGLGLDVGSATSGTNANNTSNAGRGLVWISKVQRIGGTTELSCESASPASCANANRFVFVERIRFGNGSLTTYRQSILGNPVATLDSLGRVTNNLVTDQASRVPGTAMNSLWQVTNTTTGQVPLSDGRDIYVAEVYFRSPDLSLGAMSGNGVYARWFF